MSETWPTLANDTSWLGYIIRARYTRSRTQRHSTALMPAVDRVHQKDVGCGNPQSNAQPGHCLASCTGVISLLPTAFCSPFCMTLSVSLANVSMSCPFEELGDVGATAAALVLWDRWTAKKMAYRQANRNTSGGAWWPGIWLMGQCFRKFTGGSDKSPTHRRKTYAMRRSAMELDTVTTRASGAILPV